MSVLKFQALLIGVSLLGLVACSDNNGSNSGSVDLGPVDPVDPGGPIDIGSVEVSTLTLPEGVDPRSAAFTESGKLVLRYNGGALATLNVDGSEFRPFFAGGAGEDDDHLLFADGKRIHQGTTVVECTKVFEECDDAKVVPIKYPDPLDTDPRVRSRAQEAVIAPDNKTQSWMVLLADFSTIVLTGTLVRETEQYVLTDSRIISTVEPFPADPANPGGVISVTPFINGEVKQFVHGGAGISVVGGKDLATADSMVIRLDTGGLDQYTYTPGYDETTIFSPDEKLGIVMTTRFSPATDLGIFGLMPRPYGQSMSVNLNRYMYTHGVTAVRGAREGNIGPALIDVKRSAEDEPGYVGINLATDVNWVYRSPMEWSPDSKMAVWPEGSQSGNGTRIQIVKLPDYQPGEPVATVDSPVMPGSTTDLDKAYEYQDLQQNIDVIVYGKHSGYITFSRRKLALRGAPTRSDTLTSATMVTPCSTVWKA
ncbi:MAG: hypothetical protein IPG06_18345 [Haliea sp.]|nr:hypothetical protein [Haliea sp.]